MKHYQKAAAAASVGGLGLLAMGKAFPYVKYDLQLLSKLSKVKKSLEAAAEHGFIIDHWERHVATRPDNTFLIFEGKCYSYKLVDEMANRVANWGLSLGLQPKENVAIMIENEPAFIWTFLGFQKIGVAVALINHNLRKQPLAHSISVINPKLLVVGPGEALLTAVTDIFEDLGKMPVYAQGLGTNPPPPGIVSFDLAMAGFQPVAIHPSVRQGIDMKDNCCYIYTSGTTGNPKAANIIHVKAVYFAVIAVLEGMDEKHVLYTVVPLYHSSGGGLGLFGAIVTGTTMVLRRKFSASQFWNDCCKYDVTAVQYIGELFRYLLAQPPSPADKAHKVKVAIGNGLRKDIWDKVVARYQIPKILEFYGATEGYTALINLANRPGAIGRISPFLNKILPDPAVLVKYDIATATPIRDKNGRCTQVPIGEPGLLLSSVPADRLVSGKINAYSNSEEANEKKAVKDAFVDGDIYFNYGDVLVQDKDCFVYFNDRIGDTFRWKGENVSTTEVANVLARNPIIHDANVYGVQIPGNDGRAGMAAVTINEGYTLGAPELKQIYDYVREELPTYAQPRFIRHLQQANLTATFKQRKVELAQEGFDLNFVKDPLYYLNVEGATYSLVTPETLAKFLQSKL